MAKIKPKTSGVVIDDENTEVTENITDTAEGVEDTTEPETDNGEVNVDLNIVQKAPVKNVRVLPKTDHTCVIGGERYFFKAGVQQNVPLEVKEILAKADLLSPL